MGLFGRKKKPSGPTCVACDSADLSELAPRAYRCNSCGYEGGPGFAAYQAQQQVAALAAQPPDKLRARARAQLHDIRGLLTGIQPGSESIGGPRRGKRSAGEQMDEIGQGVVQVTEDLSEYLATAGGFAIVAGELENAASQSRGRRGLLVELRQSVQSLRQVLYAWSNQPGVDPAVGAVMTASDGLMVDAVRTVDQKRELLMLVDRLEAQLP